MNYCYMMLIPQIPFVCQPAQFRLILLRLFLDKHTHIESQMTGISPIELQPLDSSHKLTSLSLEILEFNTAYSNTYTSILGFIFQHLYLITQPKK